MSMISLVGTISISDCLHAAFGTSKCLMLQARQSAARSFMVVSRVTVSGLGTPADAAAAAAEEDE